MKIERKSGQGTFVCQIPEKERRMSVIPARDPRALNALVLAEAVFEIEKAARRMPVRTAEIPLFEPISLGYDLAAIRHTIHELLIFVLVEDIDIRFKALRMEGAENTSGAAFNKSANVCLFSGGIDSYVGVLVGKEKLGELEAVFYAHSDQSKTIHLVHRMQRNQLSKAGIPLHKVGVPSIQAQGYAQLRGFLYTVASAAWMHVLKADKLVVTECGPTMYQPRFSPFDLITMTTHPVVLGCARQVISSLLGREVQIIKPFENLTKAEVMAISPDKDQLKITHSCISQRFGSHDGTCYGCVIRRLAGIAAGIRDAKYEKNPLVDARARSGNLFALLTYCFNILTDYSNMEDFETETIEIYGKQDLFRRFALDNFAAVHRLILEGHRVQRPIRAMYEELISVIGTADLDGRLAALRAGRFSPQF
ncbi:MAG: hypothetical protein MUP80_17035 [Acidobacteriia bacterium]|nr:hypothetical protein [Terriglobia bacterium]